MHKSSIAIVPKIQFYSVTDQDDSLHILYFAPGIVLFCTNQWNNVEYISGYNRYMFLLLMLLITVQSSCKCRSWHRHIDMSVYILRSKSGPVCMGFPCTRRMLKIVTNNKIIFKPNTKTIHTQKVMRMLKKY